MLRKIGSFLKNSCKDDIVFLKLTSTPELIAGPFYISNRPEDLIVEKSIGQCHKINIDNSHSNLPWWIAEGFNWLIFFNKSSTSKFAVINKNINLPNLGILSDIMANNLLEFLNKNGKNVKELVND